MFKPLLAYTVKSVDDLSFPVIASPKLDGIRCLIIDGEAVTRSLKPIPNEYIRDCLRGLPSLDGELIVGNPTADTVFQASTSGVMSRDGEPDFRFHAFDLFGVEGFSDRLQSIAAAVEGHEAARFVEPVEHILIESADALAAYEAACVEAGYEGIMVRAPGGAYKCGRSTAREGILGKVKRFADTEAVIVGFEELMVNGNEATKNALGRAERSTRKDGLTPGGTLGALVVKADEWDDTFKIGTGFDAATRQAMWDDRDALIGQLVTFRHQPSGAKDAPRFPSFAGIRKDL